MPVPFEIVCYRGNEKFLPALKEIFYLSSSRQTFADAAERDAFFQRWAGYYVSREPQNCFLALDSKKELLGYITGCADSKAAAPHIPLRSYSVFADLFDKYPAHLHINCHPRARSQGVGSALIRHLIGNFGGAGIHLITSPGAANIPFYRRNGFTFEVEREWEGKKLLFMGRAAESRRP